MHSNQSMNSMQHHYCYYNYLHIHHKQGFPDSSVGKESTCNAGKPVQFLGWDYPLEKGQATHSSILGLPCGSAGKESACNAGDLGSIPGLGRSSEEGKCYTVQYSGLENPMDCPWGCKESDTTERLSLSSQMMA